MPNPKIRSLRLIALTAAATLGVTVVEVPTVAHAATTAGTTAVGTIAVADSGANQVAEFGTGGGRRNISATWNGSQEVAFDPSGDLYVANTFANTVVEIAPDGTVSTLASVFPIAVAVGDDGSVYVVTNEAQVQEFAPGQRSAPTVIGTGLRHPEGVAVDAAGDVYIADSGNGRVVEVTPDGTQTTVPFTGLQVPVSVAVDPNGTVYTDDSGAGTLVKLTAKNVQSTVTTGLSVPAQIALTTSGAVLVANSGTAQIIKVAPNGAKSVLFAHSALTYPTGVAVYAPPPAFTQQTPPSATLGQAYSYTFAATAPAGEPAPTFTVASGTLPPGLVLNAKTGVLSGKPTSAGQYTFTVEAGTGASGTLATPSTINVTFALPTGTNVFVADSNNDRVLEFPATGRSFAVGGVWNDPQEVTFDAAGDLYVAERFHNRIVEVQPNGAQSTVAVVSQPLSVAVDSAGNIYTASAGQVDKFTPGKPTTPHGFGSGLNHPVGVAVDAADDVFIADTGNARVVEVAAADGTQTTLGFTGLVAPQSVAVDAAGDVYVSDSSTNSVLKLTPGGTQTTVASGLSAPMQICVNSSGTVYIANSGANDIVEVTAKGARTVFAHTGLNDPAGVAIQTVPAS